MKLNRFATSKTNKQPFATLGSNKHSRISRNVTYQLNPQNILISKYLFVVADAWIEQLFSYHNWVELAMLHGWYINWNCLYDFKNCIFEIKKFQRFKAECYVILSMKTQPLCHYRLVWLTYQSWFESKTTFCCLNVIVYWV